MADFSCNINATIEPPSAKPGDTIRIKADVSDVQGEIRHVILSVPQYGMVETLKPQGDGSYSLSYTIPWEAPSTTYDLRLYATSTEGERSEPERLNFTVM